MPRLTLAQLEELACRALTASRTSAGNARIVADSIAAAEADGIPSHGLLRLPAYSAHARSGKVDGFAAPVAMDAGPATVRIDARNGFAHPAIELALERVTALARGQGIAAAAIFRSYNSGVMGHHVERLARSGLVALGFSNAPAVIAPWGGSKPLFGTNPIAFASPRAGDDPLVVDQASSVVARGEVMIRARRGEAIPEGWGLDAQGKPTTDANAVLEGGSMAPAGGYKGVTLALMVEVLAASLTGALRSSEAGSLTDNDGRPAGIGQLLIAIDPGRFGGSGFDDRMEDLCSEILAQPEARLPGSRRFTARRRAQTEGVSIDESLLKTVESLAVR